ncbi:hypothetical protein OUZ56_019201 [Daphnia magna]|uniref:Uncharacterized protein n=1 Tax=Daphnia magna TaxID=35525 RepID=A0ABQ9ZAY2_9CRUS|nr:hypothetical protein OUZ56_019201 [Daphnia magna]
MADLLRTGPWLRPSAPSPPLFSRSVALQPLGTRYGEKISALDMLLEAGKGIKNVFIPFAEMEKEPPYMCDVEESQRPDKVERVSR